MSIYCVCTESGGVYSPGQEQLIALGTQAVLLLPVLLLGQSLLRTVSPGADYSSLKFVVYTITLYILFGQVYLLCYTFGITRPHGVSWKTGCTQCDKEYTYVWDVVNVYSFPDPSMVPSFAVAFNEIYLTYASTTAIPWKYSIGMAVVLAWYLFSEYALQRSSLVMLVANVTFLLVYSVFASYIAQRLYAYSVELFGYSPKLRVPNGGRGQFDNATQSIKKFKAL